MERLEVLNWFENWADRHGVELAPYRKCRPGEHRVGWARMPREGSLISPEALNEALAMGNQLTFEEWGPPPSAEGFSPAGGIDEVLPPVSITGGRVTEPVFRGFGIGRDPMYCGVDQMTFTGHTEDQRLACLKMLQTYLGEGQPGLYGRNFYRETHIFDCGAMMCFSPGRNDFSVTLRGRSMRQVGQERHRQFIIDIWKNSTYATRLDVRIDDYSRNIIRLEDFEDAYNAGNWAGARQAQRVDQKERAKGGECRMTGKGLAFGSRKSTRTIAYDKMLESKGEICATRLETAYHDERAKLAFEAVAQAAMKSEVDFVRSVGELVTGPVDFVDRRQHRHLKRMKRLDFWQRIIDACGWVRLRVEKAKSTLMGCARAITRQYVKRLGRMAVIAESAGVDLFHELFTEIENARSGQELHQVALAPREMGFDARLAFKAVYIE